MTQTGFQIAEIGIAVLALFFTVIGGVSAWLISAAFKVIFGWIEKIKQETDSSDKRLDGKVDEVEDRGVENVKELRSELKDTDQRIEDSIRGLHKELKEAISMFRANDREHYQMDADMRERIRALEIKVDQLLTG